MCVWKRSMGAILKSLSGNLLCGRIFIYCYNMHNFPANEDATRMALSFVVVGVKKREDVEMLQLRWVSRQSSPFC